MECVISTQWNGDAISHAPVKLRLARLDTSTVGLEVEAPFFGDPQPAGPVGQPFPSLWDYEVVEAFFLGKEDKYLEVELNPHGQHLVLLLNGRRNLAKDELSLEYEGKINRETMRWTGFAKIPEAYFPPCVTRFNAYAIHGTNSNRVYEALYPAENGKHPNPDFHRLEYFKSIDMSCFLDVKEVESDVWKNAASS